MLEETDGNDSKRWPLTRFALSLNYRATLRVACRSGRCASSWRRRASRTALPRWSVRNDHRNYRATLRVACRSGRCASSWRRRASRTAFPRWSVRNDHRNYRATLRVACRSGRSASSLRRRASRTDQRASPTVHIRPLARARSSHRPSTTRRSSLLMRLQRVISVTVRWQPVHISCSSSAQILTHGERSGFSIGVSVLITLPAPPGHGRNAGHCVRNGLRWLPASSSAHR